MYETRDLMHGITKPVNTDKCISGEKKKKKKARDRYRLIWYAIISWWRILQGTTLFTFTWTRMSFERDNCAITMKFVDTLCPAELTLFYTSYTEDTGGKKFSTSLIVCHVKLYREVIKTPRTTSIARNGYLCLLYVFLNASTCYSSCVH